MPVWAWLGAARGAVELARRGGDLAERAKDLPPEQREAVLAAGARVRELSAELAATSASAKEAGRRAEEKLRIGHHWERARDTAAAPSDDFALATELVEKLPPGQKLKVEDLAASLERSADDPLLAKAIEIAKSDRFIDRTMTGKLRGVTDESLTRSSGEKPYYFTSQRNSLHGQLQRLKVAYPWMLYGKAKSEQDLSRAQLAACALFLRDPRVEWAGPGIAALPGTDYGLLSADEIWPRREGDRPQSIIKQELKEAGKELALALKGAVSSAVRGPELIEAGEVAELPAAVDGRVCPECAEGSDTGGPFCPYCGARFVPEKTCPSCGEKAETDGRFCPHCGSQYADES
jgi:RNA polymerase subunit RPABC4/transcription elongation factor Spt4